MRNARQRQLVDQVQQQALLRFGPDTSALRAAATAAAQQRTQAVATAHSGATGVVSAIDQALPAATQIYRDANRSTNRTNAQVATDLAPLSNVADSIKAASDLEAQNALQHITQAKAATLTGFQQQKTAARGGEQYAVNRAQTDFVDAMTKVLQAQQDLAGQKGAFTSSTLQTLLEAELNRQAGLKKSHISANQSERNSIRTSGIDPNTGLPIKGGKLDPKAKKDPNAATHTDYKDATSQITQALTSLGTLDPSRNRDNRLDLGQLLRAGHESQQIYDTVPAPTSTDPNGTKTVPKLNNGVPVKTPSIPKFDDAFAQAALDMYYDGHVSADTVDKLRKLGLRHLVKRLPVKRHGKAPARPATTPVVNAGLLSEIIGQLKP